MKHYRKLGALVCCLLLTSFSLKATNHESLDPEKSKSDVSKVSTLSEDKPEPEKTTDLEKKTTSSIDSTYNSLIKYNFVFYFIYKHSYENKSKSSMEAVTID